MTETSTRSLQQRLIPLMPTWRRKPRTEYPDDLAQFASHGNSIYGRQPTMNHPIKDAPLMDACGGTIYFDKHVKRGAVQSVMSLCGMKGERKNFVAFFVDARDVREDHFLCQMRIVPYVALIDYFSALAAEEYDRLSDQPLSVGDTLYGFIEEERARWSINELAGSAGGDGDMRWETLGFGLMVENAYYGICRIWSRPWLITK